MEFISLYICIWCTLLSFLFAEDRYSNSLAITLHFFGVFFLIAFIAAFTWSESYKSIFLFYFSFIITVISYIYQYCITVKFFEKRFFKTRKKIYLAMLKITVLLLSLIFCFWIVVIYGMFLTNNEIILQDNPYEDIPKIVDFFDISGKLNYFFWLVKVSNNFFIIGAKNLFIPSPTNDWELFMTVNQWIYQSVIFLELISICLHNILVVGKNYPGRINK